MDCYGCQALVLAVWFGIVDVIVIATAVATAIAAIVMKCNSNVREAKMKENQNDRYWLTKLWGREWVREIKNTCYNYLLA